MKVFNFMKIICWETKKTKKKTLLISYTKDNGRYSKTVTCLTYKQKGQKDILQVEQNDKQKHK